ncbi:MAG: secondary thiamine-phosphate synthase enzyme YjbQ [Gammaproteobacteria bacterium]|nr:secondary thiamine-phosphate synthase enzyme YjbQ [Gammaproteobacteria bacterium]MBU1655870.1 secondary thiamine-phosphate synthase enzyme YjbQ [Gammaproteobacteria bacterium]MBU1960613.1 secondary thiamine-phosphate synthase enzyme YjbQ [Gammaproteobacteria bacterium]
MAYQESITLATHGRGTRDINGEVARIVASSGIETGICHLFLHHTSASLILCENADPSVRSDLETILRRLAPDADPSYSHTLEGPDDMSAHVRSILTQVELSIPVSRGRLALGTWQGIFLYEHRTHSHRRTVTATVIGQ